MTLFCLNLTSERKALLEQIISIKDYAGFNKSQIITAGLTMLVANDQIEKDPKEPINLFMPEKEIHKYIKDNINNKDLEKKLKEWTRIYNGYQQTIT